MLKVRTLLMALFLVLLLGVFALQWLDDPEDLSWTSDSTEFLRMPDEHNVSCRIHPGISAPLASLLCGIETNDPLKVNFPEDRSLCLIGEGKCDEVLHVPTADEVTKAADPPVVDHETYLRLVLVSEKFIPPSWWRDAYTDSSLLLTPRFFPLRLLRFSEPGRGARLGNLTNCLARELIEPDDATGKWCRARKERVVFHFKGSGSLNTVDWVGHSPSKVLGHKTPRAPAFSRALEIRLIISSTSPGMPMELVSI